MTARFQGPLVDPTTGCVKFSNQSTAVRPGDAVDFRGMAVSPDGLVYSINDTGQPRVFQDGIAIDPDTGLTIVGPGPVVNISMGGLGVNAAGAVVLNSPPDVIHQGVGITNSSELCGADVVTATLFAFGKAGNGVLKGLVAGTGVMSFARASDASVTDFEGLVKTAITNELRFEYGRRVENLATGLVTETITVISGNEYQLTIKGDNGATAVCSGAFTGTLTADGANRISWNSGIPKTSTTASLTITVTGTLTQMLLEDVTGQNNQNPSEDVPITGGTTDYSYVDGVRYFYTTNGNTVDAGGIVTEGTGASAGEWYALFEPAATNLFEDGRDLTQATWDLNATVSLDQVGLDGVANSASLVEDDNGAGLEVRRKTSTTIADDSNPATACYFVKKDSDETRFPGSNLTLNGGTGLTARTMVNTKTGAITTYGSMDGTHEVVDFSPLWWKVVVSITNNGSGNNNAVLSLYPALGTVWGTASSAATGSIIVDGTGLYALSQDIVAGMSPVFTSGAPATRAVDDATPFAQVSGNVDETVGMLVLDLNSSVAAADLPATTALVSLTEAINSLFRLEAAADELKSFDGTNTASDSLAFAKDNRYRFAVRWSAADSEMQVGYMDVTGAGSWQWGTAQTFDGAYVVGTDINIFYSGPNAPQRIKNLTIYDSDQGTQWIEDNY